MIIVVGAGIAGLSLAYALVKRGADVTVLEAGEVASGASGVATSYLEPRLGNRPIRLVEQQGLVAWDGYASELQEASGLEIGFRQDGQLRVALPENLLKFEQDEQDRCDAGCRIERLSPHELLQREPALSPDLVAGLYVPDLRWVDGSAVCAALVKAIRNGGGCVITGSPVGSLDRSHKTVLKVWCGDKSFEAETLILATGIKGCGIMNLPVDMPVTRPVRGVNLVFDMSGMSHPLRHMIKHFRGNMVPRGNRNLLVGTTYEKGETSLEVSPDIIERLYVHAEPILPGIRDLPLINVTAGLRSRTPSGDLALGRSGDDERIAWTLGHAGSGFLRAPVIAESLADFIIDGKTAETSPLKSLMST